MTPPSHPARAALLCAGLIALAAPAARGEGVSWLTDYNAARRAAHDLNRPLVIDFSTDNCIYCRQLETVTFRDPAVVKLVGEHFIALHVHVGAGGNPEAAALAHTLAVEGYPTLVFADPSGKVLARQDGFMKPGPFVETAQRVLASVPPAPADPAVLQAMRLTAPPSESAGPNADRAKRAGQLLGLAQSEYASQHYLGCLERCKELRADFADLPEGAEAGRLEEKIHADPDQLRSACDNLTDHLGEMYLDLADSFLHKQQPDKAMLCLEWVVQACPGTPQAETARGRLARLKEGAAKPADH